MPEKKEDYREASKKTARLKLGEIRRRIVDGLAHNFGIPQENIPELMREWAKSENEKEWGEHDNRIMELMGSHTADKAPADAMVVGEALDDLRELDEAISGIDAGKLDVDKIMHLLKKHGPHEPDPAEQQELT